MSDDHLRDMIAAEAAERVLTDSEPHGDDDLLSWFRNSPVHIAEYLGMAKLGSDLAELAKQIDDPVEKLIAEAREDSNIFEMPTRDLRGPADGARRVRRPLMVRAALSLAMVSVVVALGLGLILNRPSPGNAIQYTTGHGEERTVRLADGTFVHLNTDSTLDVKFERDLRLVELARGEAFFEVAKVPSRPFRVAVGVTEFQDVGTAFNVLRGNGSSVVTVAEGWVGVLAPAAAALSTSSTLLADLGAGEQAKISASGAITAKSRANLSEVLAWTRQQIVFDRESVGEVAAEFNRYNDVPISVRDRRIANLAISGGFRTHDERAFVSFLNHLPGVQTDERDGMIIVSARK